jgi:hypothetical protein
MDRWSVLDIIYRYAPVIVSNGYFGRVFKKPDRVPDIDFIRSFRCKEFPVRLRYFIR